MPTTPAPNAARKLAAKRHNERMKLVANTASTIGLGVLAASTIIPIFGQAPTAGTLAPWWTGPLSFVVLFSMAFGVLRFLRSEE